MSTKKETILTPLFIGSICLAAFLRLYHLGEKSMWQDEQWTYVISSKGFLQIIEYLKIMADRPPLHLFLTRFALFGGDNDTIIRLVPALFGIGGVFALYYVGTIIFSKQEAGIAAFLLAISSYHIRYSQEATAYTIFFFFSILSVGFFFLSLKTNKKTHWSGLTLCSCLTLYSSYFGLFLLTAITLTVITLWITTRFTSNRVKKTPAETQDEQIPALLSASQGRSSILSIGCAALLFLPWVPILYSSFTRYKGDTAITWITISPSLLFSTIKEFSSSGYITTYLLLTLFLIGAISSFKEHIKEYICIFWCAVTPFLILFILKPQYHFFSRYVIFILPLYLLGIAKGVTSSGNILNRFFNIKSKYGELFLVTTISCSLFLPLRQHYEYSKRDWRSASALITKEARPGDIIAIDPPFLYYSFFYYLPIEKEMKMELIDPLTRPYLVDISLNNSVEITVCHSETIRQRNLLKRYKRLWYIVTSKKTPEVISEKVPLLKKIPGASKDWDILIYRIEIEKLA